MNDCNLVKIPFSLETNLSSLIPIPCKQTEKKSVLDLLAVNSLQYLATITWLDIAYCYSARMGTDFR